MQGKIWVNNHAHILLARNNKYVKYALNYVDYQSYVTGTTRLKLNQSALKRIIIPFPDENEQKRIVAKIEELFSEIDNAESAITTASGYYKSYEQSIIDSLFAKYEAEAEMVEFGDIAEIKGGITKGRKLRGMPIGETPYLRVANVQDGYLYLDEIKTINVTAEELRKYSLMNGDILFTEGGDKDKLGRGTIWHGEIELCIHQNHIFRARVDSGQFVPEYISYATKTTRARDYLSLHLALKVMNCCAKKIWLPSLLYLSFAKSSRKTTLAATALNTCYAMPSKLRFTSRTPRFLLYTIF
ncbi:hypothetical protein TM7_0305 [candidate division TM7 genomosp. GTL1]|nr:hypothetical protein TM7_0305 [candidate division TM7 genomosp. GTL1]